MSKNPWNMRMGAGLIMQDLAGNMYKDLGACLAEIVRNAWVACMARDKNGVVIWEPEKTHVEIWLVKDHPLNPGQLTLVIMDAGSGFTAADKERFSFAGRSYRQSGTEHENDTGAAQKGVGKIALFALSETVSTKKDPNGGVYIMTRTSSSGVVEYVFWSPRLIEDQQTAPSEKGADASELWRYKNYRGSFSVFVIPNPVFKTTEEIREALAPYLPRRMDRQVKVLINGARLEAPPLATQVTAGDLSEGVAAYISRIKPSEVKDGKRYGIYITDMETGLRVAYCPAMHHHLPYPLGRVDAHGDILVRRVLAHQNTARDGLTPRYFRTKEWQRVHAILATQIAPRVLGLYHEEDVFGDGSVHDKVVDDVSDWLNDSFGEPQPSKPGPRPPSPGGGTKKPPRDSKDPEDGKDKPPPKPRNKPVNIDGKTYFLQKMVQPPMVYAELVFGRSDVIGVNPIYEPLKTMVKQKVHPDGINEHILLQILGAAQRGVFPENPTEVATSVSRIRSRLKKRSIKTPGR